MNGAQVSVLLHDPLGIVPFDEPADGVPQLRDVAVDAAMDDLFLERAIEPLGDEIRQAGEGGRTSGKSGEGDQASTLRVPFEAT